MRRCAAALFRFSPVVCRIGHWSFSYCCAPSSPMLGVMPLFRGHERGRFFPCAGLACASLRGAMAFWIFFHNALDIPIYLGLLSTCPAPPRGALEGAQVCGAAEGGAGDAALSFRGLAGSDSGGADAVALFGATRHRRRRPKPCGPGARSRAPLRTNGDSCAFGAITPAGPCRGTRVCPASGG